MSASNKLVFVVSGRLDPRREFRLLEFNASFTEFSEAQERASEWLKSASTLTRAKPETRIDSKILQYMTNCGLCLRNLFENDVVYVTYSSIVCYPCSYMMRQGSGFYDTINISNKSLDIIQ